MPLPPRPKIRVNRLTTSTGLGAFILENPFEPKNDAVRIAILQALGLSPDWWNSAPTYRVTPAGPEFYDATHEVWMRMGFDAGQPTYTEIPADWPDAPAFRQSADGPEFYDDTHNVWVRMTFDNGQPVFTALA